MVLDRIRGMARELEKCNMQTAMARREVTGLESMGTMCAVP